MGPFKTLKVLLHWNLLPAPRWATTFSIHLYIQRQPNINDQQQTGKVNSNNRNGEVVIIGQWFLSFCCILNLTVACCNVPNCWRLTMQRLLITGYKLGKWVCAGKWPLAISNSQFALFSFLQCTSLPLFSFNCTVTVFPIVILTRTFNYPHITIIFLYKRFFLFSSPLLYSRSFLLRLELSWDLFVYNYRLHHKKER